MKSRIAAAFFLCLIASSAQAEPIYDVIVLNTAGLGQDRPNGGRAWDWADGLDINDSGWVVGNWQDNAFAYNIKTNSFLSDFGFIGRFTTSGNSYATGVNNNGQIVGWAGDLPDRTGSFHFFIYDIATNIYTVIGVGNTIDIGIPVPTGCGSNNNAGFPFGCLDIADDGTLAWQAAYTGPSAAELLSSLDPSFGFTSITPHAINGDGTIVANAGFDVLIMTPATVPEPGTLALMGFGLAGIAFIRRRAIA